MLGDVKINHPLFMDNLPVLRKKNCWQLLVFSNDIKMEFGTKKCVVIILKRKKLSITEGIKRTYREIFKQMNNEGYR